MRRLSSPATNPGDATTPPSERSRQTKRPGGTRLVVLDVRVDSDRIRVFAHTLSPAQVPAEKTAYGRTEFVFPVDPAVIARGDVAKIERRIEQVIPVVSAA